ncbi:hypothetical protein EMPS_03833 [Entomortierella parvispora]|uniref:Uncharacterized protein n=1 Tax=Entomortierella parvispora TaxID=205924 RepID=A0A9P3LUW7_9FUNG|nr:hypothetical protein EMPS_03833 [Entomortierella parvispora]
MHWRGNTSVMQKMPWMGLENVDKESCLHFRDAFVALSGMFNLYSPMARKVLSTTDRQEAMQLCLMPELNHKDEELSTLLNSLKTTIGVLDRHSHFKFSRGCSDCQSCG